MYRSIMVKVYTTEQKYYKLGECVYFIQSLHLLKIGITQHLSNRLIGMLTDNPHGLLVRATIHTPMSRYLESYLHKIFLTYKYSGEWYAVNFDSQVYPVITKLHPKYFGLKTV